METCLVCLCGLLIASGVLSSTADGNFGKRPLKGLAVNLHPTSLEVLGGNVTLSFQFPNNFTGFFGNRTFYVFVHENATDRKLFKTTVPLDRREISVILPCEIFDHPDIYSFKYRISDSEYGGVISQKLKLQWGRIIIDSPTNHTVLTRLKSIKIRHDRKCLPKAYRDELNLYYVQGGSKSMFVTRKYIRKLSSGKQRIPKMPQIRMGFSCNLFDAQGVYFFEYRTGYANVTLAKSAAVYVNWGKQTLFSPVSTIFPCTNSLAISFTQPSCSYARIQDAIVLAKKDSNKPIVRKAVQQGHDVTFFSCTLFKDYVEEYCFHYSTTSRLTKSTVAVASLCLPSGKAYYEGWSTWSSWGLCSSSCGQGKQHRSRYCLSVSTSKEKESTCDGSALISRSCALNPCPESGTSCSCGCRLTEPQGMITSSPQLFTRPGNPSCTWVITLAEGKRVRLWFDALKMNGDSIIIRDGKDRSAPQLVIINDDSFKEEIVSTGNSMYLFYKHNGRWTNGTRRGFTASYSTETDDEPVEVIRRRTLGTAAVTFLAVFVFAVLVIAVLLFIVFTKLRQHHKNIPSSSSGSSSTSESTLRSTGTSSPLEDETFSNQPSKTYRNQRTKKGDRRRSSHRKRTRRTEFLCDADHVPRCTCGEISELDSATGSNSASEFSPVKAISGVERVLVREDVDCDCPECLRNDRYPLNGCPEFRAPEKKYYGDWMLTEMPAENKFQTNQRIYRDPCQGFV